MRRDLVNLSLKLSNPSVRPGEGDENSIHHFQEWRIITRLKIGSRFSIIQ